MIFAISLSLIGFLHMTVYLTSVKFNATAPYKPMPIIILGQFLSPDLRQARGRQWGCRGQDGQSQADAGSPQQATSAGGIKEAEATFGWEGCYGARERKYFQVTIQTIFSEHLLMLSAGVQGVLA